jgi:RHS repeat-associated protein
VLFQTNASGTVTGHATYRGFGRHATSGNLGERGFAGGFELPGLGLTVLGPRVLDADAGRFLSPDPVFNAVNQYAYAQGNPVFLWDPTGRCACHPVGGLESLNFGSLGLGSLGAIPTGVGGDWTTAGRPGGPPVGDEKISDQTGRALVGAFLIASGVEMIDAGATVFELGVAFAPATRGTSVVAGTIGGGFIFGIGVIEVGAGLAIANGDIGATGSK